MTKTAGVILAGGLSSRMQKNKAFIKYKNRTLINTMLDLLNTPLIDQVFISGNLKGYQCINDIEAYQQGPAKAMINCINQLTPSFDQLLFIPIDMPKLNQVIIDYLLLNTAGCYFLNHPLPIKISAQNTQLIKQNWGSLEQIKSIKDLIKFLQLAAIKLPANYEKFMININTPTEYQKLINQNLK